MIDIVEIQGCSLTAVKAMVANRQTDDYTIVVPKSTQQFFSDSLAIAYDYAKAAYVGQRLSDISSEFSCSEVNPAEFGSFEFELKTRDQDALAQALLEISYGYLNAPSKDFDFDDEVQSYIDGLEENDNVACPSYVDIFEEFVSAEVDEEEDE